MNDKKNILLKFDPLVHVCSNQTTYHVNQETRCELFEEEHSTNTNESGPWTSGHEFFIDTEMFRGKGCLRSRSYPNTFPINDPRYHSKQNIFRVVGHVKRDVLLNDLFFGGTFENGVRGLPPEWITNIGISIARQKSHHFCIRVNKKQPYVAVPFVILADSIMIVPLCGRSSRSWEDFNLQLPIEERWAENCDESTLQMLQTKIDSSSAFQRSRRHSMREILNIDKWAPFKVTSNDLFAFELLDSALMFEDLQVKWWLANFIPVTVDLKRYIREFPVSLFEVKRSKDCKKTCGSKQAKTFAIPQILQTQGLCDVCFPPTSKSQPKQFLFSIRALSM